MPTSTAARRGRARAGDIARAPGVAPSSMVSLITALSKAASRGTVNFSPSELTSTISPSLAAAAAADIFAGQVGSLAARYAQGRRDGSGRARTGRAGAGMRTGERRSARCRGRESSVAGCASRRGFVRPACVSIRSRRHQAINTAVRITQSSTSRPTTDQLPTLGVMKPFTTDLLIIRNTPPPPPHTFRFSPFSLNPQRRNPHDDCARTRSRSAIALPTCCGQCIRRQRKFVKPTTHGQRQSRAMGWTPFPPSLRGPHT